MDRRALRASPARSTSRTRSPRATALVLALPHLGSWDFAGAWLAGQGYTVTVVAEPLEPPELFDWFVETRRRLGMRVVPLSPTAGAEVLRALRANEAVCLLCDRDLTGDGVEVEFFGERTTLPGGPGDARAAHRRAAAVPSAATSARTGTSEIRILDPIDTPSDRPHPRRHRADHPGARAPVRGAHPRRARALAPDAAELAQRPDNRRSMISVADSPTEAR